jgi:hypothetical protein
MRALPFARASWIEPVATRSSKWMISALMKPFSKSAWMTPAACGAFQPLPVVQARDSFGAALLRYAVESLRVPVRAHRWRVFAGVP